MTGPDTSIDLRLNPRVIAAPAAGAVRAELARLGFAGDVRDLAPPRMETLAVVLEGLSAAEAYDLRARWAACGAAVLVAGDPFASAPVPAVVTATREQFEKGAAACAGFGPGEALARAVRAFDAVPAPVAGLEFGTKTHVMGILNVTPDSFSDGGRFADPAAAVAQGERLAGEGAALLDIGGESTRPGAEPVGAEEETRRVVPVIRELAKRVKVPLSVDTAKAAVARAALDAGAALVNDVTGLRGDAGMASLVAERGVPVVVMHIRGTPRTMQANPSYRDVVGEICGWLRESVEIARNAGVAAGRIVVDPGIGFGKTVEHNLEILHRLREFRTLGRPLLLGVSRKSFLGKLTGLEVDRRAGVSAAAGVWSALSGADFLRAHDVRETVDALKIVDAVRTG
jgi:dihydropteroate synthase